MGSVKRSEYRESLGEVIERILDKGIGSDDHVRVSVVVIEILTIEARIVIASVDTWLR
ncbi:gas vesicle protein GvpJ, partial [Staphylococcus simulans]